MKAINENITNGSNLKLMQYNKGNSNFETYNSNLQYILNKYEPDIICISEPNVNSKYNFNINNFPGYNLILNRQYN